MEVGLFFDVYRIWYKNDDTISIEGPEKERFQHLVVVQSVGKRMAEDLTEF